MARRKWRPDSQWGRGNMKQTWFPAEIIKVRTNSDGSESYDVSRCETEHCFFMPNKEWRLFYHFILRWWMTVIVRHYNLHMSLIRWFRLDYFFLVSLSHICNNTQLDLPLFLTQHISYYYHILIDLSSWTSLSSNFFLLFPLFYHPLLFFSLYLFLASVFWRCDWEESS